MCDLYATPLLYEILFKYSANNLCKQVSQIDYVLDKKSIVSVKCSDIISDQNVKLAGHIQNLVGQCPMTNCYFQLCSGDSCILVYLEVPLSSSCYSYTVEINLSVEILYCAYFLCKLLLYYLLTLYMYVNNYAPAWVWRNEEMENVTVKAKTDTNQASKLAPVIRHLSSKFEVLTGEC